MALFDAVSRRAGQRRGVPPEMATMAGQPFPEMPSALPDYQEMAPRQRSSNADLVSRITSARDTAMNTPSKNPVYDAIGRTLTGFSRGFNAANENPNASGGAGLAGLGAGVGATAQGFADQRAAREARGAPFNQLLQDITKEDVSQRVKQPYESQKRVEELDKSKSLFDYELGQKEASMRRALTNGGKEPDLSKQEELDAKQELFNKGNFNPDAGAIYEQAAINRRSREGLGLRRGKTPPVPAKAKTGKPTLDEIFK
jgi:hypothetical protein